MATTDPRQLTLQALSRALNDPAPKLLLGSKAKPGFFLGSTAAVKQAAQRCVDQGWLEPTGTFEGKGKSRKELYRLTPAGAREAVENAEAVVLVRDARDALEDQKRETERIRERVEQLLAAARGQTEALGRLAERLRPVVLDGQRTRTAEPTARSDGEAWLGQAVEYLREFRRRSPYANCPLPELFRRVAQPAGLSIGQFHDGLRRLVKEGKVRLHAFTGAAYQLQDEEYALVAGQEIKFYAEPVAGA